MANTNPRILIVDDSRVDQMMLAAVLRKEGFDVLTASNGADGYAQAHAHQPDIILLDVMMPDESGFETCGRLKKDARTSAIPVIFLSAADGLQSRVAGLTVGGVDYIIKPFEREEVLARLRIHLRIRRAFAALVEQQQTQLRQLQTAQRAILVQPADLPEARFAVYCRPMQPAGGDFYEVLPLGQGIAGYFSADIGGHGLGAAFLTSALKVLLRQNFSPLYTPLETMGLLNSVLRPVLSEGVYLSAACTRLNRQTGQLSLVSAGHPPLLLLPANGEPRLIAATGDLLGAFDSPTFDSLELSVSAGDRFLLYSDGLIETNCGHTVTRGEGTRLLIQAARSASHLPLAEMVETTALTICRAGETPADDLMLLGVEV